MLRSRGEYPAFFVRENFSPYTAGNLFADCCQTDVCRAFLIDKGGQTDSYCLSRTMAEGGVDIPLL
jgi:hypothetical protein